MNEIDAAIFEPEQTPVNRGARAVLVLLLVELAAAAYFTAVLPGWQSITLTGALLTLTAVSGWIELRSRDGRENPGLRPLLLGAAWLSLFLFSVFISAVWLPLVLTLLLFTIGLASILFDRTASSRPMVLSLPAAGAILLVEFVLNPAYRLSPPAGFITALPYLLAFIAVPVLAFLLRQFSALSLRQKLVISFLFLALVPMASIRYLYDVSFRQSLTESANQNLFAVASQTALELDNFIDSNRNAAAIQAQLPTFIELLELPAESPDYPDQLAEARELIYNLQELNADEYLIGHALLDRTGHVILDTSVPEGLPNPAIGANLFNDPIFFNPALQGIPYASPMRVTGGMETARITFGNVVLAGTGQPIGVFLSHYSAEFFQEIIDANEGLAGPGSYGILVDENEIFLAHAREPELAFSAVGELDPALVEDLVAQQRLPAEAGMMRTAGFNQLAERLNSAARQPYFTFEDEGTINQVAAARMSNYPWLVAFFQPEEVFLAPLNTQSFNSLLLAAVITAAAVGIAIVASNQLAGPILRLTEAAEQVTGGNLEVVAEVNVMDEVGTLSTAFNSMTRQLREMLGGLERIVAERTNRLEATNEVGRIASSILNRDDLVSNIVTLISSRFGYYYAAIFLVDGEWAVLQDATGEAGQELKARGHRLKIGGKSMVGTVISTRTPRIALDVGAEPARFDNPLLPDTRSEIALPLIVGDSVLGALDVQSVEGMAFDERDIDTLQTLANQVAIALENASLFERTQRSATTQRRMTDFATRLQQSSDVESILSTAVREIAGILDAEEITIRLSPDEMTAASGNGHAAQKGQD